MGGMGRKGSPVRSGVSAPVAIWEKNGKTGSRFQRFRAVYCGREWTRFTAWLNKMRLAMRFAETLALNFESP